MQPTKSSNTKTAIDESPIGFDAATTREFSEWSRGKLFDSINANGWATSKTLPSPSEVLNQLAALSCRHLQIFADCARHSSVTTDIPSAPSQSASLAESQSESVSVAAASPIWLDQFTSANRFVLIGPDGKATNDESVAVAVLEPARNLMWARSTLDKRNFADANKACAELTLAGFDDWRLPAHQELVLLPDIGKHKPAIDTRAFPDTKSDFYWSSSVSASAPRDYAWGVSFGYGSSLWYNQYLTGFVRAVRSASASQ